MDDLGIPVYLVVCEYDRSIMFLQQYGVCKILRVYSCDLSQYEEIWNKEIAPLQNVDIRGSVMCHIYIREPANPFSGIAEDKENTFEFQLEKFPIRIDKEIFTIDLPLGEKATDNPYESLVNAVFNEDDSSKDDIEGEVPYHERVWYEGD